MNTFAQIKRIARYNKVTYYSVCMEEKSVSLFEEFLSKHTVNNQNKLNHILSWMKIIGNKYGAKNDYFRNEAEIADTTALPPKKAKREPAYIENGKKIPNNLRLYCFRANESIVFLFNGDIKTTFKAQDCPNVAPHFELANKITAALEKGFREKELIWNEDCSEITYDNNLMIYL